MQFTRSIATTVSKRLRHNGGISRVSAVLGQHSPAVMNSYVLNGSLVAKRGLCAASNGNKQPHKQLCTVAETRVRTTDTSTGYSLFVKKCMEVTGQIVFGTVVGNAAALALLQFQPSALQDIAWTAMFFGQISPLATVGVLVAHREMYHDKELDKETNCSYEISYTKDSDSRKIFFGATAFGASAATFFHFWDIFESMGPMVFIAPISVFGGALLYSHFTPPQKFNVWGPTIAGNIAGLSVAGLYTGYSMYTGQMSLQDPNFILQLQQYGMWSTTLLAVNTCAKYTYEGKIPDHLICALMAPLSFMVFFW